MSTSAQPINYAKFLEFNSVPAAVVFTILYGCLFGWFFFQSFVRPTFVHFVLTFFCIIRIAAFSIRTALAASDSAGENLGLVIADEVLFGVGFFGLLFSAYTLVLDLELLSGLPPPTNPILRFTRNRKAFRFALTIAVALGIASASMAKGSTTDTTANTLHKISTVLFLVLTLLQAYQTALLVWAEYAGHADLKTRRSNESFGSRHAMIILLLVSVLLLIREAFATATVNDSTKQNNEHLWYPFLALPELLSVCLYTTPGLVPSRNEIAAQPVDHEMDVNVTSTRKLGGDYDSY